MDSEQLLALVERCEQVSGPDRELDCLIAVAAGGFFEVPPKYDGGPIGYGYLDADGGEVRPGHGGDQLVPKFTASLDAAITLAPEGYDLTIDRRQGYSEAAVYSDWNMKADGQAKAATPALALTAASLRALAASMKDETHV